MKRLVVAVSLVSLLAAGVTAAGQGTRQSSAKSHTLTFKVSLIQEATYRHPHPPDGNPGDVFSTTLRLYAVGPLFGRPNKFYVGTMSFSYLFKGACGSEGGGCTGTTDVDTLTRFPDGTLTASGSKISLGRLPYIIPILSGTGMFKGATGTVSIAPSGSHVNVYDIKLP